MLSPAIEEALNTQVNKELYSAYLYFSMSAYFESVNLKGFANWMRVQAQEEQFHAVKLFDYINERGGRVVLRPIEGPETEWENPTAVFRQTQEHERYVTSLINGLVRMARDENDFATETFLQWYVTEQVEEEAGAADLLERLKLAGDRGGGLFMLDRELAARVFTPPVQ
ncbi:MAG TPA: ferritin [bacterium]|nr:ferritin [bacterium]HPJ72023.1 ferritin [bacterium]HPQ67249.1 ferritin [bacterium]